MHLVDLSAVKKYCNITNTTLDTMLDGMMSAADTRIVEMCNQQIAQTQYALQFAPNNICYKTLPNRPIQSLASLKYLSATPTTGIGGETWTDVTSWCKLQLDQYNNASIYFPAGFSENFFLWGGGGMLGGYAPAVNYQATYVYGYSATVQLLQAIGTLTAGTFTLTYNGTISSPIAYNIDNAGLLAVLQTFDSGVTLLGAGLATGFTATFSAGKGYPLINTDSLTGGIVSIQSLQMPATIRRVAMEMVEMQYKESDTKGIGGGILGGSSTSFNTGSGTETKSFIDMQPKWKNLLRQYALLSYA